MHSLWLSKLCSLVAIVIMQMPLIESVSGGLGLYSPLRAMCPRLPPVSNGKLRIKNSGRTVRYQCRPGYTLLGEKRLVCREFRWDNPPPKCIKSGCFLNKTALPNTNVEELYGGALVKFACYSGYVLSGPSVISCNGLSWNASIPLCWRNNEDTSIGSCNLEKNLCGWVNNQNDNFDWKLNILSTPSGMIGTGPSYDHTLGFGRKGHYLYLESSSPQSENDTAILTSPYFPAAITNETRCFIFWYHMYGAGIGQLNVYVNNTLNFTEEGNHGNRWIRGVIPIQGNDIFKIKIEGIRGPSYAGDIAIDDFEIGEGSTCEEIEIVPPFGSCAGRCFSDTITDDDACYCNYSCQENSTCCSDFTTLCATDDATPTALAGLASSSSPAPFPTTSLKPKSSIGSFSLPNRTSTNNIDSISNSINNNTVTPSFFSTSTIPTTTKSIQSTFNPTVNSTKLIITSPRTTHSVENATSWVILSNATSSISKPELVHTTNNPIFKQNISTLSQTATKIKSTSIPDLQINNSITVQKNYTILRNESTTLINTSYIISTRRNSTNEKQNTEILPTKVITGNSSITPTKYNDTSVRGTNISTSNRSLNKTKEEISDKKMNNILKPNTEILPTKIITGNSSITLRKYNETSISGTNISTSNRSLNKTKEEISDKTLNNIVESRTTTNVTPLMNRSDKNFTKLTSKLINSSPQINVSAKFFDQTTKLPINSTSIFKLNHVTSNVISTSKFTPTTRKPIVMATSIMKTYLSMQKTPNPINKYSKLKNEVVQSKYVPLRKFPLSVFVNNKNTTLNRTRSPLYIPFYTQNRTSSTPKPLIRTSTQVTHMSVIKTKVDISVKSMPTSKNGRGKMKFTDKDRESHAPYKITEESDSKKPTVAIVSVFALVSIVCLVIGFFTCKRKLKRDRAYDDDSDVQFLTSDELINFNLARPSPDRGPAESETRK